ncbi:MAG: tetratricopeptide repeat protein [Bacteroidota bacterium]
MIDQKSIAVLPFDNLSAEPDNEYFSDGMTEEIINALSKINGLKVTARTSSFAFKGLKEDVRIIGNKLGVSTIIEGSIRKSGSRMRISVQLIRTDSGFQIWSESFDRTLQDIFDLQDEISLLVADRIRENFGHIEISEHLVNRGTSSEKAYELLLKGSFHLKRKDLEDIKLALSLFQEAVDLDPSYAEAYAYLAETYLHYTGFNLISQEEGFEASRQAATAALDIDTKEPRAHKVMAYVHLFFDWEWDKAIKAYNKAIAGGLSNENEFITYYYIFIQKDYELAIAVAKDNLSKDPLHVISQWQLGLCYYFAGKFEKALDAFEESLHIDPQFSEALRWKGLVLGYLGRYEEGLAVIDASLKITNGEGLAKLDRLRVQALMGEKEKVITALENESYIDPCDPATLYSALSIPDKAVEYLKQGLAEKSGMMVSLKHWWAWDNIRDDEGFKEVYRQMKFDTQKYHKEHPQSQQLITSHSAFSQLTDEEADQYLQKLNDTMLIESTVTDNQITLRSLAEMIDLHPNKLSWLLNMKLGKNFNDYVNTHRLAIFQHKAADPANAHITLLGLAYESGFTSKSVFNEFFKKSTGLTPKAWMKANIES